ncbi:hypothetical protein [Hymenobacter yonginensis]|uniref:Uncharacterized protein n=1 Tax=Hymenobacter yonginensis TaxID=748197 RepID=A0ABY7PNH3_9BACT|nr:hypothetical protein [Hymenobacter yonginensis]WBO84664.1 hypothetical protein O9Z63_00130 [Hymenobacter yonginensis]
MKYFLLFGGCALLAPAPLHAQKATPYKPGYVVSLAGDTVRGYVLPPTARTMGMSLRFRLQPTDPDILYPLKTVRGAGLQAGKTYRVRKLQPVVGRDTLRLLFQPLAVGSLTLYRLDYEIRNSDASALNGTRYENTFYYLEQGNNALVLVQAGSFRQVFGGLLATCAPGPVTGRFDEANLRRLVSLYNACGGSPPATRP